jgi:hypothetical protein
VCILALIINIVDFDKTTLKQPENSLRVDLKVSRKKNEAFFCFKALKNDDLKPKN